ncbi:TPA: M20/M25/M40 family metallo-hydrolase [Candidatus Peregrinibacteria bacterium]|nr:M20/M25/M40 family metallo-hydrolase [Candidatus Peregrinibacteria bacterium]HIQ57469.1 M20/M25/M40 family metallo-hydrolase [Candidatus Gracilibacteria bacterium]
MNILEIFTTIVQIDSESGNEEKISVFIQNFLAQRNIEFSQEKEFQIIAKIPAKNKNISEIKKLMFCAHMDTVSPGKNIEIIIDKNGKITSSGNTILGADNKASLANMLLLIDKISKNEIENHHQLEFVFTTKEEIDEPAVYKLNIESLQSELGFIFDKANEENINTVVSVASSISDFTVELKGKGAHASTPERAINALEMLISFVSELKLGNCYPNSTLNIGVINGGEATNTVPSVIHLAGDFRSESPEYMKKIEEDLRRAQMKVLSAKKFKDANIDINIIIYCKGYTHNVNSPAFKNLEKIYSQLGYDGIKVLKTQSGSDASCFMNHRLNVIETFCLNDGCFEVHTVKEWTTIENLEKLQEIMQKIVKYW